MWPPSQGTVHACSVLSTSTHARYRARMHGTVHMHVWGAVGVHACMCVGLWVCMHARYSTRTHAWYSACMYGTVHTCTVQCARARYSAQYMHTRYSARMRRTVNACTVQYTHAWYSTCMHGAVCTAQHGHGTTGGGEEVEPVLCHEYGQYVCSPTDHHRTRLGLDQVCLGQCCRCFPAPRRYRRYN